MPVCLVIKKSSCDAACPKTKNTYLPQRGLHGLFACPVGFGCHYRLAPSDELCSTAKSVFMSGDENTARGQTRPSTQTLTVCAFNRGLPHTNIQAYTSLSTFNTDPYCLCLHIGVYLTQNIQAYTNTQIFLSLSLSLYLVPTVLVDLLTRLPTGADACAPMIAVRPALLVRSRPCPHSLMSRAPPSTASGYWCSVWYSRSSLFGRSRFLYREQTPHRKERPKVMTPFE